MRWSRSWAGMLPTTWPPTRCSNGTTWSADGRSPGGGGHSAAGNGGRLRSEGAGAGRGPACCPRRGLRPGARMGRPGPLTAGHQEAEVTLRPATEDDSGVLLEWRNDPEAVRFSVSGRAVTPVEHREWLSGRLADPGTFLWIAH